MDHATQVALGRRLLAMRRDDAPELAGAPAENPVRAYTSPEQLAAERERLFRSGPILAGLSGDAPDPGDWFGLDVDGVPVLVVRGEDGELRAFQNVCRHRGAPVASGRGSGATGFSCPYHAWRYDLRGALVACSHARGFEGVDRGERSLVRLPCAEALGLVYLRPRPGPAIDVVKLLEGAEREIAPFGFERYARFETRTSARAMNWKLVVDTFLEAYHLPSLHRKSLAKHFPGGLGLFDGFGRNGRLAALRRSIGELAELPESDWNLLPHTTLLYLLFPNNVLIYQQDHVQLWRVFPRGDAPSRSIAYVTVYTPQPATGEQARRHFGANFDLLMQVTNDEDFDLGERIQQGFETGAQQSIVYGRNEPGLIHFHRQIREAL